MLTRDYPESYRKIVEQLDLREGLAFTQHWSAEADFLQLLIDDCHVSRPDMVLECSSGLSTLVLARCCQIAGRGRVLSLENGPEYAQATRDALRQYRLDDWAEVIDAPLIDTPLADQAFQWYDLQQLPALQVDMLVIDGPPGFLQPRSRYPALPLLYTRLGKGCRVFLDDAAREDERLLVAQWLAQYPTLRHDFIDTRRGCSLITLGD